MTAKLKSAQKGYGLLKKKADILNIEFHQLAKNIVNTNNKMLAQMSDAMFSLCEAKYVCGEFSHLVLESPGSEARFKVQCKEEKIAGKCDYEFFFSS